KDSYVRVRVSRGGQSFSVGTERHTAPRGGSESRQAAKNLAGGHLPEFYRAVETGRGEEAAVRTEGYACDKAGMALTDTDDLARHCVPDPHGAVHASAGKQLPVRAVGNAVNLIRVSAERAQAFAARQVPDF